MIIEFPKQKIQRNPVARSKFEFLFICKETLVVEDYEEVLLCIMDEEYYKNSDDDIRHIVDMYYQQVGDNNG